MSTFQKWLHEQDAKRDWDNMTPTRQMRLAWNAAKKESERDNAALRAALVNADELERYSGSDGRRQWGRCSAWLNPDDAVVIISAKALDAARKEAQP